MVIQMCDADIVYIVTRISRKYDSMDHDPYTVTGEKELCEVFYSGTQAYNYRKQLKKNYPNDIVDVRSMRIRNWAHLETEV